ncbi:MAG TPA: ATP-binding protein [Cyclobacteriaceae bacterium]|nr:ATP-binding protein [Cyclobacteriaceae bacterium]
MAIDSSGGSIIRKVLLAFALGIGAIIIALSISYFGLNRMLTVVYDLGAPNEKLKTLNNLYRKTTALNDQQRIDAIQNPDKPGRDFIKESNDLLVILDSLTKMPWSDSLQVSRLEEMRNIIQRRNNLFLAYLKIRSDVLRNRAMASKFDTLTELLSKNNVTTDSSVRTSQKKSTTITYLQDTSQTEGQKRSFFSKLFRKKTPPLTVPLPDRTVKEEVEVTVDTIAVAMNNTKVAEATRLIDELGMNELAMRKKLADRELALLATTRELFRELVDIVHLVESEEMERVRANNESAINVVDDSSGVIVAILFVFSLMAAALIYLIVIDITRSNYFRDSLVREKERAEELSLVKERFLSNMSHEIRTPLQAIIGYSEQLRANPNTDKHNALQAISNSSEHLLHIVNEVLDYSRLESGKIEYEKKDFYLLETAEEVVSAMRIQAEKKGLELNFESSAASNDLVEGDQFRLRQVLYNLVGNAIKFTSKGSVMLTVTSTVEHSRAKVKFEVADTGIGIKKEDINKIFRRFEQASPAIGNQYGGTGLGLTIVKMIVEGQKGTLRVNSKEGEGSSFVVELSYLVKTEEQHVKSETRVVAPANIRVLVLDDDALIVDLCGLILESARVPFEVHANPEELFKSDIDPSITHILMDVRLGNVDGIALCRSIKSRFKKVKVIAMTAGANSKASLHSLNVFDGLLRKPFRAQELHAALGLDQAIPHNIEPITEDQFSLVRNMTNNDEELFQSILADFVGETRKDIDMVEQAINEQKDEAMLVLVHKLSGRVNQFGFGPLSLSLRQIEKDLETGETAVKLKARWNDEKERLLMALMQINNLS